MSAEKTAAAILRGAGLILPAVGEIVGARLPAEAKIALGASNSVLGLIADLVEASEATSEEIKAKFVDEWHRADALLRDGGELDRAFAENDSKLDRAIAEFKKKLAEHSAASAPKTAMPAVAEARAALVEVVLKENAELRAENDRLRAAAAAKILPLPEDTPKEGQPPEQPPATEEPK